MVLNKKKIGLVLSSPPGYSETFFTSKIKGLSENGNKVMLFCQKTDADFDLCELKTLPKPGKNPAFQILKMLGTFLGLLPHLGKVSRYHKLEKAEGTSLSQILKKIYLNAPFFKTELDWVHFGFATMAMGRELVPKAIGAKMAVSFRGFDIAIYPLKNPNCYAKLWKNVEKVHTISDDLLHLAYKLGLPKNVSFQKITPAINTAFFSFEDRSFESNKRLKFLTVSRLHWKKGLVATLEALSLLKNRGIDFEYTIVGSGEEYERIAFAIHQLHISEKVILAGRKNPEEVLEYYKNADVYIQYSISEGFCNAVLEAQAMGLLCVVSNAEGLSENVAHEKTGWVVQKNSPDLLADRLEKVISLPISKKQEISINAVKRVQQEFNIEKQQGEFVEFYTSK